ncbi:MAG: cobalt ECF transporter T component CbiQ [Archaeoglobaceae archaeon]
MEDLERIQVNARRLITGDVNIYFSFIALIITLLSEKAQLVSIPIFMTLSLYAAGKNYFKLLEIPFFFLISSFAIILFTIHGNIVFEFWFLRISDRALEVAVSTFFRVLAMLNILFYLMITTSLPELISTLKRIKLPQFIVEMMFLSYRTIQVLYGEAKKLETSARVRLGYSSFKNSVYTLSLIAESLFLRAIDRVEKTVIAMELRGEEIPELEKQSKGIWLSISILSLMVIVSCLR